jgi:hypothetical protein
MAALELIGVHLPDGERAVFIVPAIRDDWPPALKDALAIRRRATIEGTCPRCGATWTLPNREERRRSRADRRILHAWMAHEPDCPAGDERLLAMARDGGISR